MERRKLDLEEELNKLVKKFGLDYQVIIVNKDDGRRGWVDTKNKVIYIGSSDPDEIYKIFLHEILEIKLNPLLNKYVRLVNALIEFIQDELYREKERVIDELINVFRNFNI